MNWKLISALPLVAVMAAAPAFAGSLGTTTSEPEVRRPAVLPPPPVGGLGVGPVIGGVVLVGLVISLMGDDNGTTTTTTE
jgi:hypothetical protein